MKLEKLLYIWIVNNLADKDSYTVNSYTLFAGLYDSNKKIKENPTCEIFSLRK